LYFAATFSAAVWPLFRASSTVVLPAIAALTSWLTLVPRAGNSAMPMNWMPGAGRGWTPGFSGSALSMADLVASANAEEAFRYSALLYV
jgi:hypothetical protein